LNFGGYIAYILTQMFEHMKNYQALFKKVSTWLRPPSKMEPANESDESLLFIHVFCHKTTPYHFVEDDGWMAKNFFSGISLLYPAKLSSLNLVTCRRDDAFP
jgi:cyclopropane fatty-acyl-phospholipid synthase-like methyltransferase